MKTKNKYLVLGILSVSLLLILGTSFALWQITLSQTDENRITTSCFKISFKDQDNINLTDAYPMTDIEGESLTPYQFTLTNTCNTHATYQINLEVLNDTTLSNTSLIKTMLNEKKPTTLDENESVDVTLDDAAFSKKLENGYLFPNEEKTFTLNLWIKENVENQDDIINKTFTSKVTIVTSFLKEVPTYASVITNCSNNGYETTKCMLDNSKYDTESLIYDETADNNLRYVGKNPNNYVDFNNEKWRIIGVMNNIEDENENKGSRLKLVRDESIGTYSWDSSSSSINSGWGINEWSQADLMKLLNPGYESDSTGGSLYWNNQSGRCYSGQNNATTTCDFSKVGLDSTMISLIDKITWNTGIITGEDYEKTLKLYQAERKSNISEKCTNAQYCNDNVDRTTIWVGYIGLIYASDYGYATSGGINTSRDVCLNTNIKNYSEFNECYSNNWIGPKYETEKLLSPVDSSNYSFIINYIKQDGTVQNNYNPSHAAEKTAVRPSLYLKPKVKITSGEGTEKSPYILELE